MKTHAPVQVERTHSHTPGVQYRRGNRAKLIALAAMLATFIAISGLSGCTAYTSAKTPTKTTSSGMLSANLSTVSFGTVGIGKTMTQSVTVTNTGTSTVTIEQTAVTGASFTTGAGAPSATIAPGQSKTIQIQFAPKSAGSAAGGITVISDASNSPLSVALVGMGAQPGLSISPAAINFGNVLVGQSGTQAITLTNTSASDVVVNLATVSGNGFGISGLAFPATIGASQSVSFNAQFSPTSTGAGIGSISFTDNATGSPQTMALSGTGVTQTSTLSANPGSAAFGNVVVGNTGTQTITLTNAGNANTTISGVTTTGTGFSVLGLATPLVIPAGQGTTFTAQFAPASTGSASGSITIASNASNAMLAIPVGGNGTQGNLTANPPSGSFGSVVVGNNGTLSVTLTNSGTASITISQAAASGAGFSITGPATPVTLTPGQNTSFTAKFAPTSAGPATGTVSVTSNAPGSPLAIALSGSGTAAQPQISASPANVSFGNVGVGSSSPQNVTLQNTGNAPVTITQASASGTGFSMSGLSMPVTINPGNSASFAATFAPTTAGSASGSISVTSNALVSPMTIPLSGVGVQAQLNASPATFNFGSVQIGNTGSQQITLTNTGTASVSITQGTASGTGFSITGLAPNSMIPAGQSASFTAQYSPTTAGSANGGISITSNAPNSPLTIALSGTGTQAQLGAVPNTAGFGTVSTGNSNSQTISLTNSGTASVIISHATVTGAGFTITGLSTPLTIPTGSNTTFNVVFAPTVGGAVTGSVSLTSNAPSSPLMITLSGTGIVGTHLLTFSTSSMSFGSVNVGSNESFSAALTNTGNSSVTISAVNMSGAGFTVNGVSSSETLTAGQSIPVTVQFAPATGGAVSGSLSLISNATGSPTAMSLSGTGVQQSPHTVGLSWTGSTSVVGYNVYRGTTTGGPYASKLTSSPVTSTQFTDSGLQSGQTYYYVVTSVDSNNVESVFSNQAVVSMP